jgi:hypothetical protein
VLSDSIVAIYPAAVPQFHVRGARTAMMETILELLLNFVPRFLVCCMLAFAAILLIAWLVPAELKSWAMICVGGAAVVVGIFWEIYARFKKSRGPCQNHCTLRGDGAFCCIPCAPGARE